MAYKIQDIEGIGPSYAEKLGTAGITNTDQLLEKCCQVAGRKSVCEACGVSEAMLLKWANMADLMRVNGVGGEYAELLEASGVDTIKELRTRNAENLAEKMKEINEVKSLTRVVPSAKVIAGWIESSKTLEPSISH
jgi:predicted flap endonuclease-1-like 5' DNA nuclease